MSREFFISDSHFGHRYVSGLRGFSTPEEHDEAFVSAWNSVVTDDDTGFILGDVSFRGTNYTQSVFDQLNGYIKIVPGNHDHRPHILAKILGDRGEVLAPIYRIKVEGQTERVVLCHFPLAAWDGSDRGGISLHGHLHGQASHHWCTPYGGAGQRINVDVESVVKATGSMAPMLFDQILQKGIRT